MTVGRQSEGDKRYGTFDHLYIGQRFPNLSKSSGFIFLLCLQNSLSFFSFRPFSKFFHPVPWEHLCKGHVISRLGQLRPKFGFCFLIPAKTRLSFPALPVPVFSGPVGLWTVNLYLPQDINLTYVKNGASHLMHCMSYWHISFVYLWRVMNNISYL